MASIWDCDKPLDAMMLSHDYIAMLVARHDKEIQELKRLVTPMMEFNQEQADPKKETTDYEKNRAAYIEYLLMCVRLGDWHGVSDAANDLRVLEAKEGK
jgi:hypothetical protein